MDDPSIPQKPLTVELTYDLSGFVVTVSRNPDEDRGLHPLHPCVADDVRIHWEPHKPTYLGSGLADLLRRVLADARRRLGLAEEPAQDAPDQPQLGGNVFGAAGLPPGLADRVAARSRR